jgi:DNA-binding CsgD family transcriptional regulator
VSETLPQQGDRRTSPGGWRVLQRAHELWRAGDYTACLTELAGESDVLALVLRGRALLRLGRPRDAIALLHDVETPSARVVLAQAFARSRDQGSAREIAGMLREARLEDPQVRAEIARCCAVIAWMGGDTDRAEADLEDALVDAAPVARAAYYQLRSWIAARRENYAEQAHLLTMAARHVLDDPSDDVGLLADITRTLATLNRDLPLPHVAPLVERLVADLPWTSDLGVAHFNAVRDLGWHHALHGRFLPALRLLHRAEALAPARAWVIMALADRAQLARWAGEPASSQATLLHALDLVPEVAWDTTDDEERSALLVAADACSEVDALRAHALLERFDALAGGFAPRLVARADRRVGAHRALVAGAVQHSLGHDAAAVESYRAAYVGFSELGYKWRAAICAGRLFALTRERSWHALGSELVREYPDGWIARDLATAGVDIDDAVRCLTPREREVLQSLLSGMRVTQIAGKLNISPHTAKHHATAIYRAFGVESQSELMAEAKRRRLV